MKPPEIFVNALKDIKRIDEVLFVITTYRNFMTLYIDGISFEPINSLNIDKIAPVHP